jgi:hypothetical protein
MQPPATMQPSATPASEPPRLASRSPAIPASPTAPVTTRNPVNEVAQAPTAVPPAAAVPSVEPSRVAQTTPAGPAPVPSTQAPAASPQSKPTGATSIPPCDKPGGMSLARIVEIDTTGGPGFGFVRLATSTGHSNAPRRRPGSHRLRTA